MLYKSKAIYLLASYEKKQIKQEKYNKYIAIVSFRKCLESEFLMSCYWFDYPFVMVNQK